MTELFESIQDDPDITSADLAHKALKTLGISATKEQLNSAEALQQSHPQTVEKKLQFLGDHRKEGAPVMFEGQKASELFATFAGESSVMLIDWLGGHEWAILTFDDGQYHYGSTMHPWVTLSPSEDIDDFIVDKAHELWVIEHISPHHKVEDDLDHEMRIVRVAGGPAHSEL